MIMIAELNNLNDSFNRKFSSRRQRARYFCKRRAFYPQRNFYSLVLAIVNTVE